MAFLMAAEIYAWFGFTHEEIPYTDTEGGQSIISQQSIWELSLLREEILNDVRRGK